MHKNAERDERILAHIGLYRVSFRSVISSLFFGGRTPGNVLHRLIAEGRIQSRAGLPNRVRYYQLTPTEAERRGLPVGRSRPPKPQALQTHLAVLWHCCVRTGGPQRRRLDTGDLTTLFGAAFPPGVYVIEAGKQPRVYRVQVVGPGVRVGRSAKVLRRRIDSLRRHSLIGPWIRNRQFGFLILTDSEAKCARAREVIERHALRSPAAVQLAFGSVDWTEGAALRHPEPRPRAPRSP
ncbi:MAG: hypothetical protein AMXMBFR58_27400 [Phycisphaerae bacterium]